MTERELAALLELEHHARRLGAGTIAEISQAMRGMQAALAALDAARAPRNPCKRCSGTGSMLSEVSRSGEVSCGDCRGSGEQAA